MTAHTKKFKIKKHDQVLVIAGKDKGKTGEVLSVDKEGDRVVVAGVNVVTRHQKPNMMNPDGVVQKTKSIHISNVSLFVESNGKTVPSRVSVVKSAEGKKQRILKKTQEVVKEYDYSK